MWQSKAGRDVFMATKLTAHEENQVDLCDDMLDGLNWCSRVQHNSSFHSQVLDLHQPPNSMIACVLSVKTTKQKLQHLSSDPAQQCNAAELCVGHMNRVSCCQILPLCCQLLIV